MPLLEVEPAILDHRCVTACSVLAVALDPGEVVAALPFVVVRSDIGGYRHTELGAGLGIEVHVLVRKGEIVPRNRPIRPTVLHRDACTGVFTCRVDQSRARPLGQRGP